MQRSSCLTGPSGLRGKHCRAAELKLGTTGPGPLSPPHPESSCGIASLRAPVVLYALGLVAARETLDPCAGHGATPVGTVVAVRGPGLPIAAGIG